MHWVEFEDHTAVLLSDYRKSDDLQGRPAKDFVGVWDDEAQAYVSTGKPKADTKTDTKPAGD